MCLLINLFPECFRKELIIKLLHHPGIMTVQFSTLLFSKHLSLNSYHLLAQTKTKQFSKIRRARLYNFVVYTCEFLYGKLI
mmetsp:Transcript_28017/g.5120  ORF Transcript_28017/g.5120 Transcript_28017/m.5120 type:complete len:81 (-) Transcript_28017:281-523(-)